MPIYQSKQILKKIFPFKKNLSFKHKHQEVFDHSRYSHNNIVLEAKNLAKHFGRKKAVKNNSFFIEQGEVVGLLGPNGAGKTTSFYMVAGFIKPTRGQIFLDGQDISELRMYERALKGIVYLPQEASIFRKLSVEENIYSILELRHDLSIEEKKEELEKLLEEFRIPHIRKQFGYTLSGGERRRTEIARAFAINPKFLLLDEPFAGVDPIAVSDIKDLIQQIRSKNVGILITDHNVKDTLEVTDRDYILYLGEVLTQGTKEEVVNNEKAKELYLGKDFHL